jgi:rRNA maturation RNase YbeY
MSVEIKKLTRQHLKVGAGSVFNAVAEEVLPGWDISLAFVGPAKARALNQQLREKDYIPNVLSYVVGEKSGEIIICPAEAAKQAPAHQKSEEAFVLSLFIHGLLHIKGWVHSDKMEECERKLLAKFARSSARSLPNETTHSHRHRHRHVPSQDGRRRGALR